MRHYIFRRLGTGLLTIAVVFVINFVIMHAAPGDPITILMGKDNHNEAQRIALEEKFGLNKPVTEQFFSYFQNAIKGDLGQSIIYDRPVTEMIGEKVFATVILGLSAAVIALIIGTLLGIIAARREGGIIDSLLSTVNYVLNSLPSFWLGLVLILNFASGLKLLPSYGMTSARKHYEGWMYVKDVLVHMVLPVATLTIISIPQYFRIAKTSIQQVTNEEFVMSLRATGMDEKKIFNKYIFRNAILPTVTIFGITVAYLLTGVILIEAVFTWPGMGSLMMTAIGNRDYPLLMGINFLASVAIAVVMLLVDLLYAFLDPRIRY